MRFSVLRRIARFGVPGGAMVVSFAIGNGLIATRAAAQEGPLSTTAFSAQSLDGAVGEA